MNNNHNHHGNGFLNGFLWGAIIGGGVVFLLGTKKGKKLLKVITEGLEDVSEITDLLEEDEFEDYEDQIKVSKKQTPEQEKEPENQTNGELKHEDSSQPIHRVVGKAKRLFKGIPRRG